MLSILKLFFFHNWKYHTQNNVKAQQQKGKLQKGKSHSKHAEMNDMKGEKNKFVGAYQISLTFKIISS
jgi:hypothetical protein